MLNLQYQICDDYAKVSISNNSSPRLVQKKKRLCFSKLIDATAYNQQTKIQKNIKEKIIGGENSKHFRQDTNKKTKE